MAGRWQLSLGAKVQGETGTVEKACHSGRQMKRSVLIAIAAALHRAAAVVGVASRSFILSSGDSTRSCRGARRTGCCCGSTIRTRTVHSLKPKKTPDGRDYRAVPAGADVVSTIRRMWRRRRGACRLQDQILPQSHGFAGRFADAEAIHGDGLHPRL